MIKKIASLTLICFCILSACNTLTSTQSDKISESPVTSNEKISQPSTVRLSIPHSMKGYELYSWKVEDEWYFTMITGTNRNKTYAEITSKDDINDESGFLKITVKGIDAIKNIIKKIPANEFISWGANKELGFSLPSQEVVADMATYCTALNLKLYSF